MQMRLMQRRNRFGLTQRVEQRQRPVAIGQQLRAHNVAIRNHVGEASRSLSVCDSASR